jgi:hypothetical protein
MPEFRKISPEFRKISPVTERVETGVVEFGAGDGSSDWPGLFVRGDNCIAFLMCLQGIRSMLKRTKPTGLMEQICSVQLDGLIRLFQEPIVHPHKEDLMRKITELMDLT